MTLPIYTAGQLAEYRANVRALFAGPVVRGLFADAAAAAEAGEADLRAAGLADIPPGDPVVIGEMLASDSRDPTGMTYPELVLALRGWALLKLAEMRLRARVAEAQKPIEWSAAMTMAQVAKRFGAPNKRKIREYLTAIHVAWERVGARNLLRVDASKLPPGPAKQ